MVKIYGIVCPKTGQVRYIGKTEQSLNKRLAAHLTESIKRHSHKQRWLAGCVDCGLVPTIILLEEVSADYRWQDREREWIRRAASLGWKLTNQTAGGEGLEFIDPIAKQAYSRNLSAAVKLSFATNAKRKDRARQAMAMRWVENREEMLRANGLSRTESAKKKLAESMARARMSPEYKNAQSLGSKRMWLRPDYRSKILATFSTSETKIKQAESKRKAWSDPEKRKRLMNRWTPEARAKQAENIRNRSPEYRALMAEKKREWWANRSSDVKDKMMEHMRSKITPDSIEKIKKSRENFKPTAEHKSNISSGLKRYHKSKAQAA